MEATLELGDGLTLRIVRNEDGVSLDFWHEDIDEEPVASTWFTTAELSPWHEEE